MNKVLRWMAVLLLTPILLFLVLAVLLYCPPVQNWAVDKVAAVVSEQTGMQVSVGHVQLEWPLNLGLDDFLAVEQGDTLADVVHLTADVQLWPLLKKRIIINELSLSNAKINSDGLISDLNIRGNVGELWLSSKGIDLTAETVEVNGARLADATLNIALSDTAAVDTTESTARWHINADSLTVSRTAVNVSLPGDSTRIGAYLGHAVARDADIDLADATYRVGSFDLHEGQLRQIAEIDGIRLGIDSINYSRGGTSLFVRQAALKERATGLQLVDLRGGLRLDSAFSHIEIPQLALRTTDSDVEGEVDMDFSVLDSLNPGKARIRLNAQIGKQDVLRFADELPAAFRQQYPNHPLTVKGSVNGNMERLEVTGLDVQLPTAFRLKTDGVVHHATDLDRLRAQLHIEGESQQTDFIAALLPTSTLRLPAMTLHGDVTANGRQYAADLRAQEGQGTMRARGAFNAVNETYDADLSVSRLNVHHFLPGDSIYTVTADVKARGRGLDFLHSAAVADVSATISELHYGAWHLNDVKAVANLKDGQGKATLTGHNQLFDGSVDLDAKLSRQRVEGTLAADLQLVDLYQLRLSDQPLTMGMKGTVDLASDMRQQHQMRGFLGSLYIRDAKHTYHPEDLGLFLKTDIDTTLVRVQSGDFIVKADASGGYERLLQQLTTLGDSVARQYEERVIDQTAVRRLLPTMHLYATSGRENPLANILRSRSIDFKSLLVDLATSPQTGINGQAHLYSLNYDSTLVDTIRLTLAQKGERLTYQAQLRNNKRNPQFVFNALVDGHIHEHGALAGLRYFDERGRLGVRIGATAEMESEGIRLRLMPDRPTVGYKEFNLNKDNYILLSPDRPVEAKVDLIADDRTGLKVYTNEPDSTKLQDLTLSVNRLDLGELTSVIPYLPRLTGHLNGDYHIIQDLQRRISVASDMDVQALAFEGSPIGNLGAEFTYLQRDDDAHAIEALLMLDDVEFGRFDGTYDDRGDGAIDAVLTMTRFPLSLANGFVPDQIVGLEGYGEGELTVKGAPSRPLVNGEIYVEDAYLVSHPYGVRMRFDNDPVRIVDSRLLLENFGLYAYNDQPLNMQGSLDFHNPDRMALDLQMQARDLLLINAKQEPKSLTFGKAFVNFFGRLQGPFDALSMRGKLDVLGSTDLTYMLLDSPLSTDNRLEELVKFTDFSDSVQTVVTRPAPKGVEADLTVSVAQGARVVCNLNVDQSNYVDLMGGGDLRMRYSGEELQLTGRYTVGSGEMKYSLPIIPLKTFSIKEGSYVEFTGDPMNPRLNLTATERTKATVGDEMGGSRSVVFDCGVVITQTLNNMGLQFIIDAPEDASVSGDLGTMSDEERGKVAVAMLTTGMYLTDGNTKGFSMNSALSSFLQSEINQLAGSALKTLDLQVGIDNTTDASGEMRTDYSFKFAKRFMNNRLKIQIGGKVSSGADNYPAGQNQSFFDNVVMEYRLNQEGTQNVRLFYNQNVYDWLEGYTGEYGVGFVWRRKLDRFSDIFKIWSHEKK